MRTRRRPLYASASRGSGALAAVLEELGFRAREMIASGDNLVLVSAATAWEVAVKRASGKLDAPGDIASWIADNQFTPLSIEAEHAVDAAELPPDHRDP